MSLAQSCTPLPYTTLFRSVEGRGGRGARRRDARGAGGGRVRSRRPSAHGDATSRRPHVRGIPDERQHPVRSEEHTSELQSLRHLVCRLLLEKKNRQIRRSRLCRSQVWLLLL